jgi:hypothetical protein
VLAAFRTSGKTHPTPKYSLRTSRIFPWPLDLRAAAAAAGGNRRIAVKEFWKYTPLAIRHEPQLDWRRQINERAPPNKSTPLKYSIGQSPSALVTCSSLFVYAGVASR